MTEQPKWKSLVVQVTPEQHAKLVRLAAEQDRSMASVIRRLIERATP